VPAIRIFRLDDLTSPVPLEFLEEEFADVLAWLCTLATINDVDLTQAVKAKYLGENPPEGQK